MNTVVLVGKVSDRPFRPGNGERTVAKLSVQEESGRSQVFEFDAFGEVGAWVMSNLWVGDIAAIRGRLEERVYKERGEEVEELRIVAVRVNLVHKGGARTNRDRDGSRDGGRDRDLVRNGHSESARAIAPQEIDDESDVEIDDIEDEDEIDE
jgi:single-stranded DNA-binding protein